MMNEKRVYRILICAGETSGDMYGAAILRELKRRIAVPLECYGIGGDALKSEGVELFAHTSKTAVMGLWEVLKHYRFFKGLMRTLTQLMDTRRPDLLLTLDYPGFNLRMAAAAHQRGIRTVHYVCPQVWVWHKERIPKIAAVVDQLIALFPFEPALFEGTGLDVRFEGHPLVDQVAASLREPEPELPWGEGYRVAIFPGSRANEIARLLPIEMAAAKQLEQRVGPCSFLIPVPTASIRQLVENELNRIHEKPQQVVITDGQSRHILRQAQAAVIKSGTSTLEASLLLCPCVIVYRLSAVTYAIAKHLVKGVKHIGLVNILAQRTLCRELIQGAMTPETISAEVVRLLTDASYREAMLAGMREVNAQLGDEGATARAAEVIAAGVRSGNGEM